MAIPGVKLSHYFLSNNSENWKIRSTATAARPIPTTVNSQRYSACALLVCGQSENDVAVGNESLFFETNQRGRHDGIAAFHVLRAAAVIEAILLNEAEGISSPVFAMELQIC
jgi:hypothetical protein